MSEDAENYLGGFYSPIGLSIGSIGLKSPFSPPSSGLGAGVYATNKRLLIIGPNKPTLTSSLNKVVPGADKADFAPSTLTIDQTDAILVLLAENTQFEFGRSEVSQIELKKPPGFLRTGSMKITSSDGQVVDIRIYLNMQYEWAVKLAQAFKPEAVTLD